jgi:hypothetical protein
MLCSQLLSGLVNQVTPSSTEASIARIAADMLTQLGYPDTWYYDVPHIRISVPLNGVCGVIDVFVVLENSCHVCFSHHGGRRCKVRSGSFRKNEFIGS